MSEWELNAAAFKCYHDGVWQSFPKWWPANRVPQRGGPRNESRKQQI